MSNMDHFFRDPTRPGHALARSNSCRTLACNMSWRSTPLRELLLWRGFYSSLYIVYNTVKMANIKLFNFPRYHARTSAFMLRNFNKHYSHFQHQCNISTKSEMVEMHLTTEPYAKNGKKNLIERRGISSIPDILDM